MDVGENRVVNKLKYLDGSETVLNIDIETFWISNGPLISAAKYYKIADVIFGYIKYFASL